MKTITITSIQPISWAARFVTFSASFGVIWLFVDPLMSLIIGSSLSKQIGVWVLTILVLGALLVTATVEITSRRRKLGHIEFLTFIVVYTETGSEYTIKAPRSMRAHTFVDLLLAIIAKDAPMPGMLASSKMYDWGLYRRTETSLELISENSALENSIDQEGTVCELHAFIRWEYMTIADLHRAVPHDGQLPRRIDREDRDQENA